MRYELRAKDCDQTTQWEQPLTRHTEKEKKTETFSFLQSPVSMVPHLTLASTVFAYLPVTSWCIWTRNSWKTALISRAFNFLQSTFSVFVTPWKPLFTESKIAELLGWAVHGSRRPRLRNILTTSAVKGYKAEVTVRHSSVITSVDLNLLSFSEVYKS